MSLRGVLPIILKTKIQVLRRLVRFWAQSLLGASLAGEKKYKEGAPLADDSKISRSIVRDAAVSGQEYFIGDVSGEGTPIGIESMIAYELIRVIAIPLRGRNADCLLGLLYLDSRSRANPLTRVGKDILHAIATEAAKLVESARLVQAQREAELMHKELMPSGILACA